MATRFYFHATTDVTSGLPTTEQAAITSNQNLEGSQTTNRVMNTTIGTSQQVITANGTTDTTNRSIYVTRFVSPPIYQSSIAANTWTYSFAAAETAAQQNFPVSSTNKAVRVNCYVWRPSVPMKVGTILDGNTALTVDEGAAGVERGSTTTFAGATVTGMLDGDVIIHEVWFTGVVIVTGGFAMSFYYDGATVTTTDGTVSNHASFLETPEDLNLTATTTMTQVAAKSFSNRFLTKI